MTELYEEIVKVKQHLVDTIQADVKMSKLINARIDLNAELIKDNKKEISHMKREIMLCIEEINGKLNEPSK